MSKLPASKKRTTRRAKEYADVLREKPQSYYDYENYVVEWKEDTNSIDRYELVARIGKGKYSEVFSAVDLHQNEKKVVLKVLKPVRDKKINREILILKNLAQGTNIIQLYDVLRNPNTKAPALVFEHVETENFKHTYQSFTDNDCRYYIYQLLIALDYSHSNGIMHRDVKPQNVMIDHHNRKLRLIDWGLAEFYFPDIEYNVRVASLHYKGPELLVGNKMYDYSLDIWSLGCLFAGMIFVSNPFFKGKDNMHQLEKICEVVGSDELDKYTQKYKLDVPKNTRNAIGDQRKKDWSSFVKRGHNDKWAVPDALDLLDKFLQFDHENRPTAKEAMRHRYFDPVREK
eukprot:TRINITY_DN4669_c0_g1_i1.p1 TRINITY_DN4669_c0_g1~~TRINITY_DN4669_c0_g1_i1.p1  ORF type:complete len:343 (-),score=53.50 TRINITY_DN4669_c0_g1_i1:69-1097(-)